MTFNDIIKYLREDKQKQLAAKLPLSKVLLDMVVKHLPSPEAAQKYRVLDIWDGDIESEAGQAMVNTSQTGPLAAMITNVSVDKHSGVIATCRVYGGTLEKGSEVYLVGSKSKARIQQAGIFLGSQTVDTDKVPAGNIAYITGIKQATAGDTICLSDCKIKEFEAIDHIAEAVVTIAVRAKNTKDLPKLLEVLRQVAKEDPTIKVDINETTGEQLISGMGELHLEVIANRIVNDKNLEIVTSKPIVVYRESIKSNAGPVEGKSPNKHNRFYIEVEKLNDNIYNALADSKIKPNADSGEFVELGMDKNEAKRIWDVYNNSIFLNMTRGIQYLDEVKELLIEGFRDALDKGPLAGEELTGLKFRLVDAKLHEDAVHRGPAQVLPAIRKAIYGSIMLADPCLLEPVQNVFISAPSRYMGECSREIQNRRGIITNQSLTGDMVDIKSEVPVAEMFGFAGDIRSATSGTCLWSAEMLGFKLLPVNLQEGIVGEIRKRKGLSAKPYNAQHYLE